MVLAAAANKHLTHALPDNGQGETEIKQETEMKDSNIKDIRKLCQYWHKQGAVFFRKTTSENDIVGIVYCPYNDKPREKDSAENMETG